MRVDLGVSVSLGFYHSTPLTLASRSTGLIMSLSPQIWLTVFLGNAHYSPWISASLHWGCIVHTQVYKWVLVNFTNSRIQWVGGGVDIFIIENDEGEQEYPYISDVMVKKQWYGLSGLIKQWVLQLVQERKTTTNNHS